VWRRKWRVTAGDGDKSYFANQIAGHEELVKWLGKALDGKVLEVARPALEAEAVGLQGGRSPQRPRRPRITVGRNSAQRWTGQRTDLANSWRE